MKVLKLNKILFTLLGIHTFDWIKKPYDQFVKTFSFCFFLINLIVGLCCSVAYFYGITNGFSQFDLQKGTMFLSMEVIVFLDNIGSYISIAMNKDKSNSLARELQRLVDQGKKK